MYFALGKTAALPREETDLTEFLCLQCTLKK